MRNKKLKAIIAIALILCIIFPVAIWASQKQEFSIKAWYDESNKRINLSFQHNAGSNVRMRVENRIDGGKWTQLYDFVTTPQGGSLYTDTKFYKPKGIKDGQKIEHRATFTKDGKIIGQAVAPVVVWGDPKSGAPPVSPPKEALDKPDWSERLAASLIAAPAKWLLHAVGLSDPLELIYGGDYINQTTDGFQKVQPQPYLSIFTKSEWNGLQEFYKKINEIVPIELVLVVIFMGIAYWYSATRPDSRISFRGYVAGLFLAMLLLRIGGMMFAFLFDINKLLVAQFFSAVQDRLSEGSSFLTAFISLEQDGYIGSAVLFVIGVLTVAIINWQYVIRKVMIALLIGLLPVVAVISIIKRESIIIWFRELIANIFLQASHAAVMSFLIVLGTASGGHKGGVLTTSQFWFTLVVLLSIPSITVLVRKIFGAEGIGGGAVGAMAAGMGLGSLLAVGRALSGRKASVPEAKSDSTPSAGGVISNIAAKGGRALATAAGGLAGGMIAGPGGMVVGGALASRGAGLFADTASSLSQFISKAKTEGMIDALGLADSKQMLDPEAMYAAGQTMFGDNIIGRSAGTVMAGGAGIARRLPAFKGSAAELKTVQEQMAATKASIPELKQNLHNLTMQKKIAEARFDQAKALYGPKSERMRWANEQISKFEGGYDEATKFVASYDRSVLAEQSTIEKMAEVLSENPDNEYAKKQLEAAQESLMKLKEAEPKVNNIREAVKYIDKSSEYREAKSFYEDISAQEAEARMKLLQAERMQTREGMKEYFQRLN